MSISHFLCMSAATGRYCEFAHARNPSKTKHSLLDMCLSQVSDFPYQGSQMFIRLVTLRCLSHLRLGADISTPRQPPTALRHGTSIGQDRALAYQDSFILVPRILYSFFLARATLLCHSSSLILAAESCGIAAQSLRYGKPHQIIRLVKGPSRLPRLVVLVGIL